MIKIVGTMSISPTTYKRCTKEDSNVHIVIESFMQKIISTIIYKGCIVVNSNVRNVSNNFHLEKMFSNMNKISINMRRTLNVISVKLNSHECSARYNMNKLSIKELKIINANSVT